MRAVVASARVQATPERIYAVLADLREHWRLAGLWVDPLELGTDGGLVRIHGPLGIRRTVRTRVVRLDPPELLAGEAELGATRAAVAWTLRAEGDTTRVTLRADVVTAGARDRVLLALGGRAWMRAQFRATLKRLAVQVESPHTVAAVPVG